MVEAENLKNVKMIDYLKKSFNLKEETLWGKMRGAQDDVDDRATKTWSLPEPSSDSEDYSSSDSEAEPEMSKVTKEETEDSDSDDEAAEGEPLTNNTESTKDNEDMTTELESLTVASPQDAAMENEKPAGKTASVSQWIEVIN